MLAENERLATVHARRRNVLTTAWLVTLLGAAFIVVTYVDPLWTMFEIGILSLVWIRVSVVLARLREQLQVVVSDGIGHSREPVSRRPLTAEELAIQRELRAAAARLNRQYQLSVLVGIGSLTGPMLLVTLLNLPAIFAISGTGISCIAGAIMLMSIYANGDRAEQETRKLMQRASVEVVEAIVDYVRSTDESLHHGAFEALASIMSRTQTSDAHLISAEHRRFLYGMLVPARARRNPALAIAVLHMVEQFRDTKAEPYVQAILAMPEARSARYGALLEAAFQAAESLKHADESLSRRGTLLSPAAAPEDDLLLRPSATAVAQTADRLLRSAPPTPARAAHETTSALAPLDHHAAN